MQIDAGGSSNDGNSKKSPPVRGLPPSGTDSLTNTMEIACGSRLVGARRAFQGTESSKLI